MIDLSVIIATCNRPAKIAACVKALHQQTLPTDQWELLIGLDGPDPESERVLAGLEGGPQPRVVECEGSGAAEARNRLLGEAAGRIILFFNDDVLPEPACLEAHLKAHEIYGRSALIVGRAPWLRPARESKFDHLVASTSMIFFYDRMDAAIEDDPDRDWGFRHAWTLNLSGPRDEINAVGGFRTRIARYGHEDIELAWRLAREFDMPVLYRPQAVAAHDHRYTPEEYLDREFRLGIASYRFARAVPEFGLDLHRRDLTSPEQVAASRRFIAANEAMEKSWRMAFDALGKEEADESCDADWIQRAYEDHLPLKRLCFHRGVLEAATSVDL